MLIIFLKKINDNNLTNIKKKYLEQIIINDWWEYVDQKIYKICKMINFDDYTNENIIEHNSKWPYIPDHPYRILIIGGSGSGKTNALLNLINNQPDIDKIYLYAKDPYEKKYQYLINKCETVGLNHFNDPKAFMEYSNDMQDVYKNIED